MSIYKVIECSRCSKTAKMGENTLDWYVTCMSAQGFMIAYITGGYKSPDTLGREHFCPLCGNGIFTSITFAYKKALEK